VTPFARRPARPRCAGDGGLLSRASPLNPYLRSRRQW
jgi:hypothetical protein